MRLKRIGANLLAAAVLAGAVLAPVAAGAQSRLQKKAHHRQQTKNNWRNAAIGAGALGVIGLATHNKTLAVAGVAGAAYSASRYEHDRKSQARIQAAIRHRRALARQRALQRRHHHVLQHG